MGTQLGPIPVPKQDLTDSLAEAIRQFNVHRVDILKKAFNQLGDAGVTQLEKQYDELRDAYFEVVRTELDVNNHRYVDLASDASRETEELEQAIAQLNNTSNILKGITSVVSIVGRLLLITGM